MVALSRKGGSWPSSTRSDGARTVPVRRAPCRKPSRDGTEQGGLAHAVLTDEADPPTRLRQQVDAGQDGAVGIGDREPADDERGQGGGGSGHADVLRDQEGLAGLGAHWWRSRRRESGQSWIHMVTKPTRHGPDGQAVCVARRAELHAVQHARRRSRPGSPGGARPLWGARGPTAGGDERQLRLPRDPAGPAARGAAHGSSPRAERPARPAAARRDRARDDLRRAGVPPTPAPVVRPLPPVDGAATLPRPARAGRGRRPHHHSPQRTGVARPGGQRAAGGDRGGPGPRGTGRRAAQPPDAMDLRRLRDLGRRHRPRGGDRRTARHPRGEACPATTPG